MALWDIKGKALNVPVYQLLGVLAREKVRLYGHVSGHSAEEIAGYPALQPVLPDETHQTMFVQDLKAPPLPKRLTDGQIAEFAQSRPKAKHAA